jgi:Raf kinase inhibitor-like YbhB/YbcL family protein
MARLGLVVGVIALITSACSAAETPASNQPSDTTTTTAAATITATPTTTTREVPNPMELTITSPLFEEGATIPTIITCEGDDVSPQLDIEGLPAETVSMVVIMEDPDAPVGVWDHWVAFDVEPADSIPQDVGELGVLGRNSWGDTRYGGPCPPPGDGPHRYFITVYALDIELGLDAGTDKDTVLAALADNVLAMGALMGTFER